MIMEEETNTAASESLPDALNAPSVAKTVNDEMVWEALRQCYDPEIPVNIVDLGLIYSLKIEEEIPGEANIYIQMTLTAPGCGMGPVIAGDVKRRAQQIEGVRNVMIDLVFDPPWSISLMSESAKLALNMF